MLVSREAGGSNQGEIIPRVTRNDAISERNCNRNDDMHFVEQPKNNKTGRKATAILLGTEGGSCPHGQSCIKMCDDNSGEADHE